MNFNWEIYKQLNPDLFEAGLGTQEKYESHYYAHGIPEGRPHCITSITPDFNYDFYRVFYPDLGDLTNTQLELHWIQWGKNEGRIYKMSQIYPDFNYDFYRVFYPDLANLTNTQLDLHWIQWGKKEGRIYKMSQIYPDFNYDFYRVFYPDLGDLTNTQLELHWIQWGKKEGRIYKMSQIYPDFNYDFYRVFYPDLGDLTNTQLELHWIQWGKKEGRVYNINLNDRPRIIVYTYNFDINCGGIIALYNLAKLLNDRGIRTKLFILDWNKKTNPIYNDRTNRFEIKEDTIVIYPELIEGNPLNVKYVVRWILLEMDKTANRIPIPKTWGPNDLVYHWETMENKKQLCIMWYNPVFINNNKSGSREDTCYMVKKGSLIHANIEYFHPENSICIDNTNDLEYINNVFNRCKYFYCYDPNCAFTIFAASCGCIPIIYPINGLSAEEYFKNRIFNYNGTIYNKGIVYGNNPEDIDRASTELDGAEDGYKILFSKYLSTVDGFIEDINSWNSLVNIVQNEY
jgi:hypothetical protein